MPYYIPGVKAVAINGLPIPAEVFRADGGILRIDDELVLYSNFDAGAGKFTGCERAVSGPPRGRTSTARS